MAHRRKFGGGRGEAVAKAVGIKGDYLPDVVDATAGLGRDAFVLASVGCRVRMLERIRWWPPARRRAGARLRRPGNRPWLRSVCS
jgi:hypothetical protein